MIALLIKLLMTCFKRRGSVVMIVSVAGRSKSNSTSCGTFICWARRIFCNKGVSGCSVMLKTIVLDSIFERSSMSDISASSCSQFRYINDKNSLISSFWKDISPSTSKLEKPTMAFNGVRISWLMLARNALLSLSLCCALSRALVNSSSIFLCSCVLMQTPTSRKGVCVP